MSERLFSRELLEKACLRFSEIERPEPIAERVTAGSLIPCGVLDGNVEMFLIVCLEEWRESGGRIVGE